MKKLIKVLALMLAAAMLLSMSACSVINQIIPKPSGDDNTPAPSVTDAPTEPPANVTEAPDDPGTGGLDEVTNYEQAYTFYSNLINKISNVVSNAVKHNNERIEEAKPDDYYNDPAYLSVLYMPFLSIDMALTSSLSDTVSSATIEMLYSFFGYKDIVFEIKAPGEYVITGQDEDDGVELKDLASYSNGGIRYSHLVDGKVTEFYEFIPLGNDRYALQSLTDRAIVTYKDGEITKMIHSETRHETDWDTEQPTTWSVYYDPDTESIWGKTQLDDSWVLEKQDGIHSVYEISEGNLTVSGFKKKSYGEDATFEPMDPIVMPLA